MQLKGWKHFIFQTQYIFVYAAVCEALLRAGLKLNDVKDKDSDDSEDVEHVYSNIQQLNLHGENEYDDIGEWRQCNYFNRQKVGRKKVLKRFQYSYYSLMDSIIESNYINDYRNKYNTKQ